MEVFNLNNINFKIIKKEAEAPFVLIFIVFIFDVFSHILAV